LERRTGRGEKLVVLDLRERAAFAQAHRPGAINIPLDELQVRAINELLPADTIVLSEHDGVAAEAAYTVLGNQGFTRVFILRPQPPAP
jgi:rhodanese-related sulfurtransferase